MGDAPSQTAQQQSPQTAVPFKVFGLQRTGTNLMHALVTKNFQVRVLDDSIAGWKHGPLRVAGGVFDGQPGRFALCVKNPYAWAVSCYRYFKRCGSGGDATTDPYFRIDPSRPFEEFVISPTYSFQSPIHRWNQMYRLWLATLPQERTVVVRQEDQLTNQMPVLEAVERKLGLKRSGAQLQAIHDKVDVYLKSHGPMNADYYLDRQYMLEYSPSLLEKVNGAIDAALMKQFGYETERWTLALRQIDGLKLTVRPCTSDAADARQYIFDPYHLKPIRQSGAEVRTYLDIGAGIGAVSAWVKALWPKCRILAYEACPDRLRVLRINARALGEMTALCAAVTDGHKTQVSLVDFCHDNSCSHADAASTIGSMSLKQAAAELGEIDLLRIGAVGGFQTIIAQLEEPGLGLNVRRICGRFPSDDSGGQALTMLSRRYRVETWPAATGTFFFAERL